MTEIETFVTQAREKNLSDDAIRNTLETKGWSKQDIDFALSGLSAPEKHPELEAPKAPVGTSQSLSPLMAALHHILLWFFTGSSTITIIGVIASLFNETISTEALAAMIAVTVVTFIPYAIMFAIFIRLDRSKKGVVPGKVWSIITICLHSIGAMISAITLVVTAILNGSTSVLVGAGLVLLLNVIIVGTYCFSAFGLNRIPKFRAVIMYLHLPVLIILFGILSFLSIMQIGPAKHDDKLREDMAATAQKVHAYANDHRALPTDGTGVTVSSEVHYTKKSEHTYQLCGDFQVHQKTPKDSYGVGIYSSGSMNPISDDYVYKDQFTYGGTDGCFLLSSSPLENGNTGVSYPYGTAQ